VLNYKFLLKQEVQDQELRIDVNKTDFSLLTSGAILSPPLRNQILNDELASSDNKMDVEHTF
jgi:hypothetical protein